MMKAYQLQNKAAAKLPERMQYPEVAAPWLKEEMPWYESSLRLRTLEAPETQKTGLGAGMVSRENLSNRQCLHTITQSAKQRICDSTYLRQLNGATCIGTIRCLFQFHEVVVT
jgi:hypothetical protein